VCGRGGVKVVVRHAAARGAGGVWRGGVKVMVRHAAVAAAAGGAGGVWRGGVNKSGCCDIALLQQARGMRCVWLTTLTLARSALLSGLTSATVMLPVFLFCSRTMPRGFLRLTVYREQPGGGASCRAVVPRAPGQPAACTTWG
jgi:hypothetical protein